MNVLDLFAFALNAILPIILLIVFGYFLKRINFLQKPFLTKANSFVFKALLPCLLFYNVYQIESFGTINWSVVLFCSIAIVIIFLIGILIAMVGTKDRKRRGVILQCTFRSNFSIIGIPLAQALGGESASGIASILSAFSIPLFNILAVISLTVFVSRNKNDGEEEKTKAQTDWLKIIKKILTNPLILGVATGLVTLGIRSLIPLNSDDSPVFTIKNNIPFLYEAIRMISIIASPLALIVLGGLFDFKSVKSMIKEITVGVMARLIIAPTLAIGAAILLSKYTSILSFGIVVYPSLIALFASPVAVSSAIMAQEMDNDGELAGQYVVWTSILSILTIFTFVVVLRLMGLL